MISQPAAAQRTGIDSKIHDWTTRQWGRFAGIDAFFIVTAKWTPTMMLFVIVLSTLGPIRLGPHAPLICAAISIVSAVLARILNEPVSRSIARPRPFQESLVPPLLGHDEGDSFPSNHATGAFALAFGFLPLPGYFTVLLVLALLLAASRIYTGLHYLTDVLAGIVTGTAVSLLVSALVHLMY